MNKVLKVRNVEQAAAWLELDGQISDGMWENTRPLDHWRPWCSAKVVVDPADVGRNFYARKDNYNFTSPELLDVVGLRMLGLVRIARAFGMDVAEHFECSVGTDGKLEDYAWVTKALEDSMMLRADVEAALASNAYGMTDLKRDLTDLKKIVRMTSASAAAPGNFSWA